MTPYILDRMDAVRFVAAILTNSKLDSLSITIIQRGNSEVYSVNIATGTLSEDIVGIVERIYSEMLGSIYPGNTLDGSSLQKLNGNEERKE